MTERLQEKNIQPVSLSDSIVTDFFGSDEFHQTDLFDYDIEINVDIREQNRTFIFYKTI